MTKPTHKLTERNDLIVPIRDNEIIHINLNCPHCGWSTTLWASLTRDGRVAVVGEGLCGHAKEELQVQGGTLALHLEFSEDCSYGAIHEIPKDNKIGEEINDSALRRFLHKPPDSD